MDSIAVISAIELRPGKPPANHTGVVVTHHMRTARLNSLVGKRTDTLRLRRAASRLRRGQLLAHTPSTVSGVAAHPLSDRAMVRLQRFKQRPGPFLLLADSMRTAARWARFLPPALRRTMRQEWPGRTTLIYPGRPGLPSSCYQQGRIAVRVDADAASRYLSHLCGGLLVSSSLNRRGLAIRRPGRRLRMRWHRHISAAIPGRAVAGARPSKLLLLERSGLRRLR
ncbi:MAG TPA: Sua5/YciO/YrdC/YwlC family protein [Mariprofundaceae bacterium]|nr:Sua5/YciO/YrdC/YwlC family protein [Mariprofundaceae bacterium]